MFRHRHNAAHANDPPKPQVIREANKLAREQSTHAAQVDENSQAEDRGIHGFTVFPVVGHAGHDRLAGRKHQESQQKIGTAQNEVGDRKVVPDCVRKQADSWMGYELRIAILSKPLQAGIKLALLALQQVLDEVVHPSYTVMRRP